MWLATFYVVRHDPNKKIGMQYKIRFSIKWQYTWIYDIHSHNVCVHARIYACMHASEELVSIWYYYAKKAPGQHNFLKV